MLVALVALLHVLAYFWYKKAFAHPSSYPPGPRHPLPLFGDAYKLGKDFYGGVRSLHKQYGNSVGMWIGKHRAVLLSDFDTLQDILNQNSTALRQHSIPELRGMYLNEGFKCIMNTHNMKYEYYFSPCKRWRKSWRNSWCFVIEQLNLVRSA